jgi:hypothetical protein
VTGPPVGSTGLRAALIPFPHGDAGVSQRLTMSFLRDLQASGLFSEVGVNLPGAHVVLEGNIMLLRQPGSESSGGGGALIGGGGSGNGAVLLLAILIAFVALWAVAMAFGAPSDCGDGKAALVLRARDAPTGTLMRQWEGRAEVTACTGLYYSGWPLGKALNLAAAQVLDGLRRDAAGLRRHWDGLRAGGR